eukprot:59675_1
MMKEIRIYRPNFNNHGFELGLGCNQLPAGVSKIEVFFVIGYGSVKKEQCMFFDYNPEGSITGSSQMSNEISDRDIVGALCKIGTIYCLIQLINVWDLKNKKIKKNKWSEYGIVKTNEMFIRQKRRKSTFINSKKF